MSDKTLGQVGYEALVIGYGENVDPKEWPELSQATHDAWQAAAEAVAAKVVSEAAINEQQFYSPSSPMTEAERAVIEAAPSVAELLERVEMEHGERTGAADPFCEAVRALAEQKGE